MKVGILTFHAADNYGAVLQARALAQVLRSLGHDARVIDYTPAYITEPYILWKKGWWKHPVGIVKNLCNCSNAAFRARGFEEFRSGMRLMHYPPEGLDAVFFGSDQIWNQALTGGDTVWFADAPAFDKTRNIAYGASCGSTPIPEGIDFGRFHRISVREPQLQKVLEGRGVESTLVLDPVLLAGKEIMAEMAAPCTVEGEFVFEYEALDDTCVMNAAEEIGLPVVQVARSIRSEGGKRFSPGEFIALIMNANTVVSNSFHAIALAILFGKKYRFIPSGSGKDERVNNIISISENLDALRKESLQFIEESLL